MLHINGIRFQKIDYGEKAILLHPIEGESIMPIQISQTAALLHGMQIEEIEDVITGIGDICIVLKNKKTFDLESLQVNLDNAPALNLKLLEILVDFEQGLDWETIEMHSKLTRNQFIRRLTKTTFQFQMCGFLPGFMYLSGLPKELEVPRRLDPCLKVEAGSLGIGGGQFGFYNIESPGGWNIIGKTKFPLFNSTKIPPIDLKVGDKIKLIAS